MPVSSSMNLADAPSIHDLLALGGALEATPTSGGKLLREEVYAHIRGWIVQGLLPPETRLRDKEIAEALGVSRTPVREAIRRLQDEGLVETEASRWTKVAAVDTQAADRVYPIIWTLERFAVESSDGWDEAQLAPLRDANARLAECLDRQDALGASEADTDFHRALVAGAGNRELDTIVNDLKVQLRRIEIAYFGGTATADRSVQEHERVIDALAAGDPPAAADEIEGNWRASLERLQERLAQS